MNRAWFVAVLLGTSCTGRVVFSGETDPPPPAGTTADGSDTSGDSRNDEGGGDDAPFSTGPTPTTLPPGTSAFDESSSGFGSTGIPTVPVCWSSFPLFEAPDQTRIFVRDQDGDGIDELWVANFDSGGPGGTTELFIIGPESVPIPAGFFPGFVTGLHDVDGDGVLDAAGFAFGGGGPPSLAFVPGQPGFIEGSPFPTELGFDDGFEGFFDASGDGLADFIRNVAGTDSTELLIGDGTGTFLPVVSMPSPFSGDLVALPLNESNGALLSETTFFDPPDACVGHPSAMVSIDLQEMFTTWTLVGMDPYVASAPLAVAGNVDDGVVYSRACVPDTGATTILLTVYNVGELERSLFEESTFATVGDFDGDGRRDIVLGDPGDGISFRRGTSEATFAAPTLEEVLYDEPVPARVFVVDIDFDGRDEIVLGTRAGGPGLVYYQLDADPC